MDGVGVCLAFMVSSLDSPYTAHVRMSSIQYEHL